MEIPVPANKVTGPSELARGYVVTDSARYDGLPDAAAPVSADVVILPTQVRRPWRSTIRSAVQFGLALATLLPFIAAGVYQGDDYPVVVGQLLVVASTATRVMALPQVENFLQHWAPWLAAAPAAITTGGNDA